MQIQSATFIKGIRGTDGILEDGVPEIAFIGRSNVGKSSIINSLTNKKDLVKIGKKPGKTTEINFFNINERQYYFVDLPGYGYAHLSLQEREAIRKLILWYLLDSGVKPLTIALILDSKVGLADFDKEIIQMLREQGHHFIIVANKIDKLNQKEVSAQLTLIKKESLTPDVIPYSAINKKGREELLAKLFGN